MHPMVVSVFAALYSALVVAQGTDPTRYSDPKGNVDLSVGTDAPDSVYLGDQTPWSVLDSLNQHCNGATCTVESWTISAQYVNGLGNPAGNSPTNLNDGQIKITVVDASISQADQLHGMVEALKSLASQPQIHQVETHHYCDDDSGTPPVAAARNVRHGVNLFHRDVTCERPENASIDQYSSSATYYIATRNSDQSVRSFLRVKLECGVNSSGLDQTLCTDLLSAGSAIAGIFTGGTAIAAGLSLGSLACGLPSST